MAAVPDLVHLARGQRGPLLVLPQGVQLWGGETPTVGGDADRPTGVGEANRLTGIGEANRLTGVGEANRLKVLGKLTA